MDDFDFSPAAADVPDVSGDAYGTHADAAPADYSYTEPGGDWMQAALVGYFEGIGSFAAVDYDMDGQMDRLAVDIDADGSPDMLINSNGDGTFQVEVDSDGDGTLDTTLTMTADELQEAAPDLWSIIDNHYEGVYQGVEGEAVDVYTVQEGDSLWLIAENLLGDGNRWPEIAALNPEVAEHPDLIYPGTELVMPGYDVPVAEPVVGLDSYTVQEGDSLWLIAESLLGDGNRWPEIAALNPEVAEHPDLIYPGTELVMPDGDVQVVHPVAEPVGGLDSYTVQDGDSLWSISESLLGDGNRWPEIAALNPEVAEHPELIYAGTELVMPTR